MTTPSDSRPFADRYCAFHHLPPEAFVFHLLQHALHAPLRWIWPLFGGFFRYHLNEDRLCIETIGRLRSIRQVKAELREFSTHPINGNFSRRVLHLRMSTHRVESALKALP